MPFSLLERNILQAKGLAEAHVAQLEASGVGSRADFATVRDAATLRELLPGLDPAAAEKIMAWALDAGVSPTPQGKLIIDSADIVYCTHCGAKQPKDYKSGDLCPACGKQAEPIQSCYWCGESGPGRFCRACGAEFVPLAEFDLATLLKREGIAKEDIAPRLKSMPEADKQQLWGRVRRMR